jgi:hypothetical protein
MHATDLVGINGITRVLLLYTCQQGVYPRDHVLPFRLRKKVIATQKLKLYHYACVQKKTDKHKIYVKFKTKLWGTQGS